MAQVLCYIKKGEGVYDYTYYPEHLHAMNCDWEHAMHLAVREDQENFHPLRNNTGILFPKATFHEGPPQGTTKTLIDPWLYRRADGRFGVFGIRRNQNAPDPLTVGEIMLFESDDLVRYDEVGFLKVSDGEIRHPKCCYNQQKGYYDVSWEENGKTFCGQTKYFKEVCNITEIQPESSEMQEWGIEGAVYGNILDISKEELQTIRESLDEICHVGNEQIELKAVKGEEIILPDKIRCYYSDGSKHQKKVCWNNEDLKMLQQAEPGSYEVRGEIQQKSWPFPLKVSSLKLDKGDDGQSFLGEGHMSDPCILHYQGKYYLTSSGGYQVLLRVGDTLEGAFKAAPIVIYTVPEGEKYSTWAAELHVVMGVPYIFTALCPGDWRTVESVVLRCNGEIEDPNAWEAPRYVLKPNGRHCTEGGISLDMTYFCVNGVHYVMWSDRKIRLDKDPVEIEPADVYIATVDPSAPWQMTTEPRCILRPIYGWDRYETEVDEGPYLLRRGDDLFITISGSSTGMADLYDLGLLHAKAGDNLLTPDGWEWLPYPLLTKESVENEYGPGHNCFVKDEETGDDLMVYHAVPHDKNGKPLGRKPGIRRVHWGKNGYPYLEMTPDRDLNPELKTIYAKVVIK